MLHAAAGQRGAIALLVPASRALLGQARRVPALGSKRTDACALHRRYALQAPASQQLCVSACKLMLCHRGMGVVARRGRA